MDVATFECLLAHPCEPQQCAGNANSTAAQLLHVKRGTNAMLVSLPPGHYKLTKGTTVRKQCVFTLQGSTSEGHRTVLSGVSSAYLFRVVNGGRLVLQDVTLTGVAGEVSAPGGISM